MCGVAGSSAKMRLWTSDVWECFFFKDGLKISF